MTDENKKGLLIMCCCNLLYIIIYWLIDWYAYLSLMVRNFSGFNKGCTYYYFGKEVKRIIKWWRLDSVIWYMLCYVNVPKIQYVALINFREFGELDFAFISPLNLLSFCPTWIWIRLYSLSIHVTEECSDLKIWITITWTYIYAQYFYQL